MYYLTFDSQGWRHTIPLLLIQNKHEFNRRNKVYIIMCNRKSECYREGHTHVPGHILSGFPTPEVPRESPNISASSSESTQLFARSK